MRKVFVFFGSLPFPVLTSFSCLDELVVVFAPLFQHLTKVAVFPLSGLKIEQQVLYAQTKVVQAVVDVAHGLLELLMALLGLSREYFKLNPMFVRQARYLGD